MTDLRIITCESCDGTGREERMGAVYELGCGFPRWGEVDHGSCPDCDGHGEIEIETRPVEMEDLEDARQM